MTYYDISVPLRPGMPIWPGNPPIETTRHLSIERGDVANATVLRTDVHCGTHVDAPEHFVAGGARIDEIDLDPLLGPAVVVDAGDADRVDAGLLDAAPIPHGTTRLLIRTSDSGGWASEPAFREDFVALTADASQWVVDRGIRLIGIDYLSVQRFEDGPATHQILLRAGVLILEGIDLGAVAPGPYELICLPVKLAGGEAAPARAILRDLT